MTTLAENLKGLMNRSHKDMLSMLSVADIANMQARTQSNMDRMNAQVDAQLRKCNPDYKPPEGDDVGNFTFINAGILADQQTASALVNAIQSSERGGSATEHQESQASNVPVANSVPQVPNYAAEAFEREKALQQYQQQHRPPAKSMWKEAGKYLLPLLVGSGVSLAAAKYFAPDDTDTDTITEVDVVPWSPPE